MTQCVPDSVIANHRKLCNIHAYFKDRKGLHVSERFNTEILMKQPATIQCRGLDGIKSQNLTRDMFDQEVVDEILGGMDEACTHAFTLDQIAEKIELQPNGEDGELLNNMHSNIFYVLIDGVLFPVFLYWNLEDRPEWIVVVWRFGENGKWYAGSRVFRNTTLVI